MTILEWHGFHAQLRSVLRLHAPVPFYVPTLSTVINQFEYSTSISLPLSQALSCSLDPASCTGKRIRLLCGMSHEVQKDIYLIQLQHGD